VQRINERMGDALASVPVYDKVHFLGSCLR